jgi:hypothetical protein
MHLPACLLLLLPAVAAAAIDAASRAATSLLLALQPLLQQVDRAGAAREASLVANIVCYIVTIDKRLLLLYHGSRILPEYVHSTVHLTVENEVLRISVTARSNHTVHIMKIEGGS